MTAKNIALESCANAADSVDELLERIAALKVTTLKKQLTDPTNWGHAGDMARIKATLASLFAD